MARSVGIAELERTLAVIGGELDFPDGVDLVPAVTAQLARERARRPVVRPRAVFRPVWQVVVAAVVAFAIVVGGVLAASPGAREAVAGWLGLRGVRIVSTPPPSPPPPEKPLGEGLDLGTPATLAGAEQHLGSPILLPSGMGPPDEVYVRDVTAYGVEVFLVYGQRPGLPRSSATGVAILLSEFTGDISREGLEKFTFGARVESVQVGESRGYWIEHGHAVGYVDSKGQLIGDDLRLAGNVLLWERGPLTLRIESALSKDEALRIARSIG